MPPEAIVRRCHVTSVVNDKSRGEIQSLPAVALYRVLQKSNTLSFCHIDRLNSFTVTYPVKY